MTLFDREAVPAVALKDIQPVTVAAVRSTGMHDDINGVFMNLYRRVLINGGKVASYPMVLFPVSPEDRPASGVRFEACVPVGSDNGLGEVQDLEVRQLPAVTVAFARHYGNLRDVGRTYALVMGWIRDNGYLAEGPSRELYMTNPLNTDPDELVTEIQVPVKEK